MKSPTAEGQATILDLAAPGLVIKRLELRLRRLRAKERRAIDVDGKEITDGPD